MPFIESNKVVAWIADGNAIGKQDIVGTAGESGRLGKPAKTGDGGKENYGGNTWQQRQNISELLPLCRTNANTLTDLRACSE